MDKTRKYSIPQLVNDSISLKKEQAIRHRKCKVCGDRILKGDSCLFYSGQTKSFPFHQLKFSICKLCSAKYLSYILNKFEKMLESIDQKRLELKKHNRRYSMINQ